MTKVFEITLPIVTIHQGESKLHRLFRKHKAAIFCRHIVDCRRPPQVSTFLADLLVPCVFVSQSIWKLTKILRLIESRCKEKQTTLSDRSAWLLQYELPHKEGLIALAQSTIVLSRNKLTLSIFLPGVETSYSDDDTTPLSKILVQYLQWLTSSLGGIRPYRAQS